MKYLNGLMTFGEIGRRMGISEKEAGKICREALEKIKPELEHLEVYLYE